MAVDLHTHSDHSDGSDPPATIVELAIGAGLTAVALTDHDGFFGLSEAAAAAHRRIRFVPGVEISVQWGERAAHLLVYWVDASPGPLQEALADVREGREERNRSMVAALGGLGIDIAYDEVLAEAGHGVVGRPHIAAVLVRKGVVDSVAEAFDAYLASGRPAYRPRRRLGITSAIDLARRSGGVPVIAHPHTIADSTEDFRPLFGELASLGVSGVECHYAEYPEETRGALARWAAESGLVATGGSDYHGTYKPGLAVGIGRGDLVVPNEVVAALEERRPDSLRD